MRGKIRRPFRRLAILRRAISCGGRRVMSCRRSDRAGCAPAGCRNRHHERRFPGAVGADQRDDLAAMDLHCPRRSARGYCRNRSRRLSHAAGASHCPGPPRSPSISSISPITSSTSSSSDTQIAAMTFGSFFTKSGCRGNLLTVFEHDDRDRIFPSQRTYRARSTGWRCRYRAISWSSSLRASDSRGLRPAAGLVQAREAPARYTLRGRSRAAAGHRRAGRRGSSARSVSDAFSSQCLASSIDSRGCLAIGGKPNRREMYSRMPHQFVVLATSRFSSTVRPRTWGCSGRSEPTLAFL